MKKIAIVFFHELRILMKDRQALGLLFVMPLAFIIFLTLALQDVYQSKIGKRVVLHVASTGSCEDPKELCAEIMKEMSRHSYSIKFVKSLEAIGKTEIALVMPVELEETVSKLQEGKTLHEEERIQLIFDPVLDQSLRALVQSHLSLAIQTVLIGRTQKAMKEEKNEGVNIPDVSRFEGLVSERAAGGVVLPNPIQQTVPAWALFGMFFIVIPMSNSMLRDRRLGIFKRLLSFPVSRGELILGKVLPFLLINIIQFALMFAVGVFLLPKLTNLHLALDFSLWSVFLVTIACALAATTYGLMISCLANTPEQASAFGALSVVILAILGGVMIPSFVMPEFMQSMSKISPLYWGLEAYHDVILRKAGMALAGKKILILLAFSIVCGWIAAFRFRWNEA